MAVWSTGYRNNLPDSAFLYIAPGGKKDGEGKTVPRSLRKLPYKDATGKIDRAHLQNAISRLSQGKTNVPNKGALLTRARRLLANAKGKSITPAFPACGFKDIGNGRWVGWFTNPFRDRDRERFKLRALKRYVDWANKSADHLPELRFWHLDTLRMGEADQVKMAGPFVVAAGVYADDERTKTMRAYIASKDIEWGMSQGFFYYPADLIDGEYNDFRAFEVSVLPREWAANPVTLFNAEEEKSMNKQALMKALEDAGMPPEEIEELIAGSDKATKEKAAELGAAVGQKDGEEAEAEADADSATDTEIDGDDAEEADGEVEELAAELAEALTEVAEGKALREKQDEKIGALEAQVKALADAVAELAKREKARKELLPRATQQALSLRDAKMAEDKEVIDDGKQQQKALDANVDATKEIDYDTDPLGWIAQQAGMA